MLILGLVLVGFGLWFFGKCLNEFLDEAKKR